MTVTRRGMLGTSLAAVGGLVAGAGVLRAASAPREPVGPRAAGRLKQSVCYWPFQRMPLPEFCAAVAGMGLQAVDLLTADQWPVAREHGLICSMGYPTARRDFIATGFNDPAHHAMLLSELERTIPLARQQGVPNVIAMFGNRRGLSDAEGIANSVAGLRRIAPLAEEQGVTICLELLNSLVDHADYQGDHTAFGAIVMAGVGSPRVKLLYDIYHMQIMEGNVIATIRANRAVIAHFHTGGVPGRHELDDTQELEYRGIARAIAETGFAGYVAHEFEPTRDPLESLRQAVATCTV